MIRRGDATSARHAPGTAKQLPALPMSMPSDDTSCIWNAHNHEAFAAAQRQKTLVKVACCLSWKGRPKDMVLYGRLRSVTGREAVFVVLDREVLPRRCRMQVNTCEFFFCLDTRKGAAVVERLGYRGAGRIMGVKKTPGKKSARCTCACATGVLYAVCGAIKESCGAAGTAVLRA